VNPLETPAARPALAAPRTALLWWIAGLTALLHLVTARGYGYFRDELYYLACGDHLGLGYVDHPPLIGLVAAAVRATLGQSLLALRLLPALSAGATAWITGAIAAELGGGRFAQGLAAGCMALSPVVLSLCSYLSMNAFDLLLWASAWWLFTRLLHGGATRAWLALGAVLGVGLENKISALFLVFGLGVGLVASRRWDTLRTRGPWLAAAVAALLFAPHLAWQGQHGFPTLEFMHNARAFKMQELAPADWLLEQVLQMNPLAAPIWLAGLAYLLSERDARPHRPLGVAFLTVIAVLLVGKGKSYYAAPAYVPLFAAGGVAWERWLATRWRTAGRATLATLVVAGGGIGLPLARPVLPVETLLRYQAALGLRPGTSGERHEPGRLPQFFADMHGWPELAATVGGVYQALPEAERAAACVFAENYGQAGAIDVLGRAHGLPRAIAGHNSYWLWGPRGCTGALVIVIGSERARLEQIFERVEQGATFTCELCMPYESHKPIWVGRRARAPMTELWPEVKHYN
jgi:hypothetical protein